MNKLIDITWNEKAELEVLSLSEVWVSTLMVLVSQHQVGHGVNVADHIDYVPHSGRKQCENIIYTEFDVS